MEHGFILRNVMLPGLLLASREENNGSLFFDEALSTDLPNHQPFLNVSRRYSFIYILLVLFKNAFVCYGISNIIPRTSSVGLVITLSCFRAVFPEGQYALDLLLIYTIWILSTGFIFTVQHLHMYVKRCFLFSHALISVMPIFFPAYSSSEFVTDVFCVYILIFFIFENLGGTLIIRRELVSHVSTRFVVPAILDWSFGANGHIFGWTVHYILIVNVLLAAYFRGYNLMRHAT